LAIDNNSTFSDIGDVSFSGSTMTEYTDVSSNKGKAFKAVLSSSVDQRSAIQFRNAVTSITAAKIREESETDNTDDDFNKWTGTLLEFHVDNNTQDGFIVAFKSQEVDVSTNIAGLVNTFGQTITYNSIDYEVGDTIPANVGGSVGAPAYVQIKTPYVLGLKRLSANDRTQENNGVVPIPYEVIFKAKHTFNGGQKGIFTELSSPLDGSVSGEITLPGTTALDDEASVTIDDEEYTILYYTKNGLSQQLIVDFEMKMKIHNASMFNFAGKYHTSNKIAFIDI
jgi:hypothetical protein